MARRSSIPGAVCCICGGDELAIQLTGSAHTLDDSSFGSSRTNLSAGNVIRCRSCGFGFSEVRPAEDKLGELYRDLDVQIYEAETAGRSMTARRHLRILHHHRRPPGRLLDVGCASGRFLQAASAAGWEAFGVEPSSALFERAKQSLNGSATVLQTTLQKADFPTDFFDALTMWDVLEHVPGPVEFLALAASILRTGGCLVLNVPNLDSIQARLLGRRWPLILPEHLNYFTKPSLHLAATKAGLRPIYFGTRPAAFSLRYVAYRLRQHGVPLARGLDTLMARSFPGKWVIPVYLGEICSVFCKP